ncbi:MAG: oxidoreductase [Actinomycetota bacterium]|nr:oxidoreductase [Actinomycetota bacterium]MDQ2956054.1 oxidoreductase [Actinomycetota bacterium]
MGKVVLITGCSSGIGKAAAAQLNRAGYLVYATARRPETLSELAAAGCRTLQLDVEDEASMLAAVHQIQDEHGGIDVLVNNAGYGLYGPIEQVGIDEVRKQFDTNVFGLVRLSQLVLPSMRERRTGRILNVSSMGGRTTLPGGGFYHASKYAVEAISDALRMELKSFGVQVVLIEPGVVRTPWSEQAMQHQAGTGASEADPYRRYKDAVAQSFERAYSGQLAKLSIGAEDVAKVIERAAGARRPKARYLISPLAKSLVTMKTLLPDRLHDALIKLQYKLP